MKRKNSKSQHRLERKHNEGNEDCYLYHTGHEPCNEHHNFGSGLVWRKTDYCGQYDLRCPYRICNYVIQILISLVMVSFIILNSSRTLASVRRINEVLDTDIDLTDENAVYKDKTVEYGKIEFREVYFKYYKTMKNGFWKISTS